MLKITRYFIIFPIKLFLILISYFALAHSNLAVAQKHEDNLFFASLPLLFHAAYHYSIKRHSDPVYDEMSDRHDLYRKDVYRKEVDVNQSVAIELFEEESFPEIDDDEPENLRPTDHLVPITELTVLVEEASNDRPDHNFSEDHEDFSAFLYEETLSALHFMEQQELQECLKSGFEAREEAYNEDVRYNLRKDKWLSQVVEDELIYRLIISCPDTYQFSPSEQPATDGSDLIEVDVVGDINPRLICPICLNVANVAATACNKQHVACKACLQTSVASYSRCPSCQEESEVGKITLHPFGQRDINQINVRCPNHAKGCPATPDISDVKAHYLSCEYVLSTCERCKQEVLKVNLEAHSQRCYNLDATEYPQILADEAEGESIQSLTQKFTDLQDKVNTMERIFNDVFKGQGRAGIRSEPQQSTQEQHSGASLSGMNLELYFTGASVTVMNIEPVTLNFSGDRLIQRHNLEDVFDIYREGKFIGSSVRFTEDNARDLLNASKRKISKEFKAGNYNLKLSITKDETCVLYSIQVTCNEGVEVESAHIYVDVYHSKSTEPRIDNEDKLYFSRWEIRRGRSSHRYSLFRITQRQGFTQNDGGWYVKLRGSFNF